MVEPYYTVAQLAELLQLTRRNLTSYILEGKLHAVKIGRAWRIPESAITEFLENGSDVCERNKRQHKSAEELVEDFKREHKIIRDICGDEEEEVEIDDTKARKRKRHNASDGDGGES